jgi:hypothetical protein
MHSFNKGATDMKRIFSACALMLLPLAAFASNGPIASVPEPGTLGLLALGVGAAALIARRGRRK